MSTRTSHPLIPQIEAAIAKACLWECQAPKPGNVSPGVSFGDLCFNDFEQSAPITARWLAHSAQLGVGAAIESAAAELSQVVGRNTHLGILLLLAPLAAAAARKCSVHRVLIELTVSDAIGAYRAIRLMKAGGLGRVDDQDVADDPTVTLLECMQAAAHRDTIAAQYDSGYAEVFSKAQRIADPARVDDDLVVRLHLELMAAIPDTLIARKCGEAIAVESAQRAADVLRRDCVSDAVADFDAWLRADGHRRNPGTTADMIAAVLFVALWDHQYPGSLI